MCFLKRFSVSCQTHRSIDPTSTEFPRSVVPPLAAYRRPSSPTTVDGGVSKSNYYFSNSSTSNPRDVLQEFTDKTKMLTELTSKAMAKSLQLKENCFLDQFGERETLQARFNYYPKCQRPDLILGLKPHADGSGYTFILQDEVGLQIFNNDKWHTAPKVPHAILVLMGDQMEVHTHTNVFT